MGTDAVDTGLLQYVEVDGGLFPGEVTGGRVRDADAPAHREGIGGVDKMAPQRFVPGATINFLPVGADLLACGSTACGLAFRARGSSDGYPRSPLIAKDYGLGLMGSNVLHKILGAKVSKWSLEAKVGDPLSAMIEIMGLGQEDAEATWPTGTLNDPWEWLHGSCLIGGVAVSMQSFKIDGDNGLSAETDMDGAEAGALVLPKLILEGDESIKLDITCHNRIAPATRGAGADELVPLEFAAVFTRGGRVLTIGLTGVCTAGGETPITTKGVVTYSYPFEAAHNSNCLSIGFSSGT